jgi:gliding motility-associated-like protein
MKQKKFLALIVLCVFCSFMGRAQIFILHANQCAGDSTATLISLPNYGVPPYTYVWNTGDITPVINNLSAGIYSVTVTDAVSVINVYTTTLVDPAPITITLDSIHDVHCNNENNGGIWLNVTGGTGNLTYTWTSNGQVLPQVTEDLFTLPSGAYMLSVTDENGCTASQMFVVYQLDFTYFHDSFRDITCNNNGYWQVEPINLAFPTTYIAIFSTGDTISTDTVPIPSVSGLTAGSYSCTFTTVPPSCTWTFNLTLEEPSAITADFTIVPVKYKYTATGSIVFDNIQGGTPPYTYVWNTGDTTPVINNLSAGNYSVTITDSKACSVSKTLELEESKDGLLIPNLITPNGDGYNDVFKTEGGCEYDEFLVQIFTDQGIQVFQSTDCDFTWNPVDNNAAANTVYYYYIKVVKDGRMSQFKSSININK